MASVLNSVCFFTIKRWLKPVLNSIILDNKIQLPFLGMGLRRIFGVFYSLDLSETDKRRPKPILVPLEKTNFFIFGSFFEKNFFRNFLVSKLFFFPKISFCMQKVRLGTQGGGLGCMGVPWDTNYSHFRPKTHKMTIFDPK